MRTETRHPGLRGALLLLASPVPFCAGGRLLVSLAEAGWPAAGLCALMVGSVAATLMILSGTRLWGRG